MIDFDLNWREGIYLCVCVWGGGGGGGQHSMYVYFSLAPWNKGSKFYIFPVPWIKGVKAAKPIYYQLRWRAIPGYY